MSADERAAVDEEKARLKRIAEHLKREDEERRRPSRPRTAVEMRRRYCFTLCFKLWVTYFNVPHHYFQAFVQRWGPTAFSFGALLPPWSRHPLAVRTKQQR
jgi:hypothetical protein